MGDSSRLKMIGDATQVPASNRNNGAYQMSRDVVALFREMSRTIWSDVCLGNTAGYKESLPAWNDFVVQCAAAMGYNPNQIEGALAASHFLGCWTGDPEAFDKMCERLPEKTAEYGKKLNRQDGFSGFVRFVRYGRNLETIPPESISPGVFLEKALSQPGFVSACPRNIAWVESLASQGMDEPLSNLMAKPPASLVPELLPSLYGYRARFLREKHLNDALAATRKGLELCSDNEANNHLRGTLKRDLADMLAAAKQPDEAKNILASLKSEEIPDDMRTSYLELAKKLDVKPVVSALPPKKPEPSKKD